MRTHSPIQKIEEVEQKREWGRLKQRILSNFLLEMKQFKKTIQIANESCLEPSTQICVMHYKNWPWAIMKDKKLSSAECIFTAT